MTCSNRAARTSRSRRTIAFRCTALTIVSLSLSSLASCNKTPTVGRAALLDTTRSAESAPDVFRPDDTVPHQSNLRGRVSFGSLGPHTRTTQLFINYRDNPGLNRDYAPIGEVVEGMTVVDSLWKGYGDAPPRGNGPDQDRILAEGEGYLAKEFPKLDYIRTGRLIK